MSAYIYLHSWAIWGDLGQFYVIVVTTLYCNWLLLRQMFSVQYDIQHRYIALGKIYTLHSL